MRVGKASETIGSSPTSFEGVAEVVGSLVMLQIMFLLDLSEGR